MNNSRHRIAKLYLRVIDRMSSKNDHVLFVHHLLPTCKYLAQDLPVSLLRIADDREGGQWSASHGVDIIQGVHSCNTAVDLGIICNGRKKINSLHQRDLVRKAKNTCVV